VFSGWTGLRDLHLVLVANWIFFLLTLALLLLGVRGNSGKRISKEGLLAGILFLSIPFIHTLGISTLTEPLQYLLIVAFVLCVRKVWETRSLSWRVVSTLVAAAWMLTRYEAWVVALGLVFFLAFFPWRYSNRRAPFVEPAILAVLPALWMTHNLGTYGDALYFLRRSSVHALPGTAETVAGVSASLFQNAYAFVLVGVLFLYLLYRAIWGCPGEKTKSRMILERLNRFSAATGMLMFVVIAWFSLRGKLGVVVPERFPVQILVALCPVAGEVLARTPTALQWPAKGRVIFYLMLSGLIFQTVFFWSRPREVLFPYQKDFFRETQEFRERKCHVTVWIPPDLSDQYFPAYLYSFFYSWRRVERIPEMFRPESASGREGCQVVFLADDSVPVTPEGYKVIERSERVLFLPVED
jgi:hypothetical protein